MNTLKYKWILYFIVLVTITTIGVQVYWNYKNYEASKQVLTNDIQLSLDTAVDKYFANLAETKTIALALDENTGETMFSKTGNVDTIFHDVKIVTSGLLNLDSTKTEKKAMVFKEQAFDTHTFFDTRTNDSIKIRKVELHKNNRFPIKNISDSIHLNSFRALTSKVIISMTSDSINLAKVDSLFKEELKIKQLNINHKLVLKSWLSKTQETLKNKDLPLKLFIVSKSAFLPKHNELKAFFTNETKIILKRILSSILISMLLILAVVSCLFYLLKIIKQQKQLAEVKNDLISNITHEFKTPITTVSAALESLKNFNAIENKQKTETYLDISKVQLLKLNTMVEKLLETATLDSDSLNLNKEKANISNLLFTLINKFKIQTEKSIQLSTKQNTAEASIDTFHFDNAINNILDNAIKYGGNNIDIELSQNSQTTCISISDDGNTLTKSNQDRVFEKFYRVPKGNTHDIKGFGIGLYYTKQIIQKHKGTIHLELKKNKTIFKISIPNA